MPALTYDLPSLRALRLSRGFVSAETLAQAVGVCKQTMFNIETGKHWPTEPTLRQRARVLLGKQSGWKTADVLHLHTRLRREAEQAEERTP